MTSVSLLASALVGVFSAAVYAYVGIRFLRRDVAREDQLPATAFAVSWHALAAVSGVGALRNLAVAALPPSHAVWTVAGPASLFLDVFLLCVGFWGFLYYVAFLISGWRRLAVPLGLAYGLAFVVVASSLWELRPFELEITKWAASVRTEGDAATTHIPALFVLLLVVQLIATAAYASLLFRVRERMLRFRIAVVAVSLTAWFVSPFLSGVLPAGLREDWPLAQRFIGLAAALAILTAFDPPQRLASAFHLSEPPKGDSTQFHSPRVAPTTPDDWHERKAARLRERISELV
ncbi:MAG: hypothetical protein WDA16_06405 [Candidatus Thermoplasmatota archaeon]